MVLKKVQSWVYPPRFFYGHLGGGRSTEDTRKMCSIYLKLQTFFFETFRKVVVLSLPTNFATTNMARIIVRKRYDWC